MSCSCLFTYFCLLFLLYKIISSWYWIHNLPLYEGIGTLVPPHFYATRKMWGIIQELFISMRTVSFKPSYMPNTIYSVTLWVLIICCNPEQLLFRWLIYLIWGSQCNAALNQLKINSHVCAKRVHDPCKEIRLVFFPWKLRCFTCLIRH